MGRLFNKRMFKKLILLTFVFSSLALIDKHIVSVLISNKFFQENSFYFFVFPLGSWIFAKLKKLFNLDNEQGQSGSNYADRTG